MQQATWIAMNPRASEHRGARGSVVCGFRLSSASAADCMQCKQPAVWIVQRSAVQALLTFTVVVSGFGRRPQHSTCQRQHVSLSMHVCSYHHYLSSQV
uniref:Uncharacterized protein n=1 Tax=Aegilops tauschii subsp. strangulata TaxID=200361 RepID=A0A453E5I7_AEGTS